MYVHGVQKAKTFTNKEHAKRWVVEQKRLSRSTQERAISPVLLVEMSDYTMRQVLQKYLDEIVPTVTNPRKTAENIRRHFKWAWIDTPFNQLPSKTLNQWRDLRYKTCSNNTVWSNFYLFKTALNHAIADNWDVPIKLFRGIKLRRVVEREVLRLEDEQLTTLLEAAIAQPKCNYFPHAITFAIESCIRQSEMLKLMKC